MYVVARLKASMVRLLAVAAFLPVGCASLDDRPAPPPSDLPRTSNTARIVCDGSGARVLTPRVEARPDGVHLVIDNRSREEADYVARFPEGGSTRGVAPAGESKHVEGLPPGEVRIGCYYEPSDLSEPDRATLEVVDVDGDYKPTELDCPSGGGATGFLDPAVGSSGSTGNPVELTRRRLSERLEENDAVEIAGYPKSERGKIVRVVREGRVVATVAYRQQPGGNWLEDSVSECAEF